MMLSGHRLESDCQGAPASARGTDAPYQTAAKNQDSWLEVPLVKGYAFNVVFCTVNLAEMHGIASSYDEHACSENPLSADLTLTNTVPYDAVRLFCWYPLGRGAA